MKLMVTVFVGRESTLEDGSGASLLDDTLEGRASELEMREDEAMEEMAPLEETAGDIIERADGSYWLIDMIRDDFSPEGWLCVLGTLQHEPPEGVTDNGTE